MLPSSLYSHINLYIKKYNSDFNLYAIKYMFKENVYFEFMKIKGMFGLQLKMLW